MVFITRLSSFLFMLMFSLVEARNSIFHKQPHYQGILEPKVGLQSEQIQVESIHQITVSKGIRSNVVQVEEDGGKTWLNGRKLASEEMSPKKEQANTKEQSNKIAPVNGRSSKKSGATTPSSWKCNNKRVKRKLDHHVLCKQVNVRSIPKKAMLPKDSIVALDTADYHNPNPHPPRHN